MAGFSSYLEQKILNDILRTGGDVYISLHTEDPTADGSKGEVSGNGYARPKITFAAPEAVYVEQGEPPEQVLVGHKCVNNADTTFPDPTGPWAGGAPITHMGLWDASSNYLFTVPDTNDPHKSYGINDVCVIRAGSISVKLD